MDCLPVRPLIKYNLGDGAWMIAQKADQRKRFKAIICALKSTENNKQTETKMNSSGNKNFDNTDKFCIEGILDHCRTVDPKKIAVLNISCKNLISSNDEFYDFTSIYKIDASGNKLNLDNFVTFNSLVELNLSSNNVKNINISSQDFEYLQILDLSFNNLTNEDILILGIIKNLKTLNLAGNNLRKLPPDMGQIFIDDHGIGHLRFINLEELNLEYNHINSDAIFSSLGNLQKLTILKLAHNDLESIPLLKCMNYKIEAHKKFKNQSENDIDDYENEDNDFMNSFNQNMNMELRIPSTLHEVEEEATVRTNNEDLEEQYLTENNSSSVINSNNIPNKELISTQIENYISSKTNNEYLKLDMSNGDNQAKEKLNSSKHSIEENNIIQAKNEITFKDDNVDFKDKHFLNKDGYEKEILNSENIYIEKIVSNQIEDNEFTRTIIHDLSDYDKENIDKNVNISNIDDKEVNSIKIDQVSSRNCMVNLNTNDPCDSNKGNIVLNSTIEHSEESNSIPTEMEIEEKGLNEDSVNKVISKYDDSNKDEINSEEAHRNFDDETSVNNDFNISVLRERKNNSPSEILNDNQGFSEVSGNYINEKLISVDGNDNHEKEFTDIELVIEHIDKKHFINELSKNDDEMKQDINVEDTESILKNNVILNSPDELDIKINEEIANFDNVNEEVLFDEISDRTNINVIIDKHHSRINETKDIQHKSERGSEMSFRTDENVNNKSLDDYVIQRDTLINDNQCSNNHIGNKETELQPQQIDELTKNQNMNFESLNIGNKNTTTNMNDNENNLIHLIFSENQSDKKMYILNSYNKYFNETDPENTEIQYYNEVGDSDDENEWVDNDSDKGSAFSSLIVVNETLNSNTITDIIRYVSTNSFGNSMPKPFPALTYLDISFNKIKHERAIIPIIAWLKLKNLIIHNNPLSTSKVQNSSFIKSLLENTFQIMVTWLPPVVEEKPRPVMKKSKLKPADSIYSISFKYEKKSQISLPKLMPLPRIINETQDLLSNNQMISLVETDKSAQKPNEENLQQMTKYNGKDKLHLLRTLRYKLEHPITFFERKVDLFVKSNHLPKQKASNVNQLQKIKKADLISTILQQQKMLDYETEISLGEVLSQDYYKNDPSKLKESKIAKHALNHMQKKYNQVRLESLKKEN